MRTKITPLLVLSAFVAINLLVSCSRGPMPPTPANGDALTAIIQAAGREMTAKEMQEGRESDEAKKRNADRFFVAPFAAAGFDLDATLADYAVRLREGNLTQAEAPVVMGIMTIYKGMVADLAQWGFFRGETRDLVVGAAR